MNKYLNKLFGKSPEYSEFMFVGPLGELQKNLTELALQIAKEQYSIDLDFSHSSISKVEFILADIHEEYKDTGETEGLKGIAMEFGFYIAATIQKNTQSGVLEKDHPQIGENTFPFYWNESAVFTYGWCENRIYDGVEDNVVSKYEALVLGQL